MFLKLLERLWIMDAILAVVLFTPSLFANQIGISFDKDSIGVLGDYEKIIGSWEFSTDAQAQRTESLSLIANASVQRNFGVVGLKPFVAYNRDAIGNTVDAGGLLNFSIGELDIAAGASFRGANPTGAALEKRFDANDMEVEVHGADYSPNAYKLPEINNVNAALKTGFEKWGIETGLTAYVPITKRDLVPVVIISRSQTGIKLTDGLSLSLVMDARSYVHADGAEIQLTPQGSVVLRF